MLRLTRIGTRTHTPMRVFFFCPRFGSFHSLFFFLFLRALADKQSSLLLYVGIVGEFKSHKRRSQRILSTNLSSLICQLRNIPIVQDMQKVEKLDNNFTRLRCNFSFWLHLISPIQRSSIHRVSAFRLIDVSRCGKEIVTRRRTGVE